VNKFRKSFWQILLSASEISQYAKKLFEFIPGYWIDKLAGITLEKKF